MGGVGGGREGGGGKGKGEREWVEDEVVAGGEESAGEREGAGGGKAGRLARKILGRKEGATDEI